MTSNADDRAQELAPVPGPAPRISVIDPPTPPPRTRMDSPRSQRPSSKRDSPLVTQLLRSNRLSVDKRQRFWPSKVLSDIMTQERVAETLDQLLNHGARGQEGEVDIESLCSTVRNGYLKVFAILLMTSMGENIVRFIDARIGDDKLPLSRKKVMRDLEGAQSPTISDESSETVLWELEAEAEEQRPAGYLSDLFDGSMLAGFRFCDTQWQFLVPFFSRDTNYILQSDIILPWLDVEVKSGHTNVQRVEFDSSSHGFGKEIREPYLEENTNHFAVKVLQGDEGREEYTDEVYALQRTNRRAHSHILRLLCTFQRQDTYYLVLPWADGNLREFWKTIDPDLGYHHSAPFWQWVVAQLLGLASALDAIQTPDAQDIIRLFGRHGDIKPENILWFKSKSPDDWADTKGSLVLTDLGFARFRRERTQSRKRSTTLGFTTTYRSPEFDIANKTISRSTDTWSLGCVFLETVCWLLGGYRGVQRFGSARRSLDQYVGAESDAFFVATRNEDGPSSRFDFKVKPQVTKHIADLHRDPGCTQFIHDFLDLIETGMLVLETEGVRRMTSSELVQNLTNLHEAAMESSEYLTERCPSLGSDRAVVVAPVLEADVDEKLRERVQNETRTRMSQRFSARASWPGRSIKIRVPVIIPPPRVGEETPDEMTSANKDDAVATTPGSLRGDTRPMEITPSGTAVESIEAKKVPFKQSVLQEIDTAVRDSLKAGTGDESLHEAEFNITWELLRCLEEELDGSPDLDAVLTVSGDEDHSWATECSKYVQATWGKLGVDFLHELEVGIGRESSILDRSPPRLSWTSGPAQPETTVTFRGTATEISVLSQFLCWIAASFRLPMVDVIAISSVNFKAVSSSGKGILRFEITLRDLQSLDDTAPGTCWTPLFPCTILAYAFPVPFFPGAKGLYLPMAAMLEFADILYDINLQDESGKDAGVYLEGPAYTIYPTGYIGDSDAVQWHLVRKESPPLDGRDGPSNRSAAPDTGGRPKWDKSINLSTLQSAKVILGYCSEVLIQLGTAERRQYHTDLRPSLAPIERPPPEATIGSATIGVNFLGFANIGASTTFKTRNGLRRAKQPANELRYLDILRVAETEPVILFDTEPGKERAWMVPQISLILELFNVWAETAKIKDIHYAKASADGGAEARAILSNPEYAKRVVGEKVLESDTELQVGDVVKGIYGRIQQCMKLNAESDAGARGTKRAGTAGVVGWDWLDLTDLSWTITHRREVLPAPGSNLNLRQQQRRPIFKDMFGDSFVQPCWLPFTQVVPVFFGAGMGELMVPAREREVCRQWSPLPGGLQVPYLAASMHCIQSLAVYSGHSEPWWFFDDLVWEYKDSGLFQPCTGCLKDPGACRKQPQVIKKLRAKILKKHFAAVSVSLVEADGAVVFSQKRKKTDGGLW